MNRPPLHLTLLAASSILLASLSAGMAAILPLADGTGGAAVTTWGPVSMGMAVLAFFAAVFWLATIVYATTQTWRQWRTVAGNAAVRRPQPGRGNRPPSPVIDWGTEYAAWREANAAAPGGYRYRDEWTMPRRSGGAA